MTQTEKICTGCGRSSLNPIGEQHLACCPDNNYVTMSNNKQSSIEWLAEQMLHPEIFNPYFEQAKAMHKEEIIVSVKYGFNKEYYTPNYREQQELFEQYYNETF